MLWIDLPGQYILQAVPLGDSVAPAYFSTTGLCVTGWRQATEMSVSDSFPRKVCFIGVPLIHPDSGAAHIAGTASSLGPQIVTTPLAGASIYVTDSNGVLRGVAHSLNNGGFDIGGLSRGSYRVRLDRAGYVSLGDASTDIADNEVKSIALMAVRASASSVDQEMVPAGISLPVNYPNPPSPLTSFSFSLDRPTSATIEILNCLGVVVKRISCGELGEGGHVIPFDASTLSSGTYVYRLHTREWTVTRPMNVIR